MNIHYPKVRSRGRGPGVRSIKVPRLHIGWNDADVPMWDEMPFQGKGGKLAYKGGAVVVIEEEADSIRITIIKSHTGKRYTKIGDVRVIDGKHTTEVIIENPLS